jgi:hypothetical protein
VQADKRLIQWGDSEVCQIGSDLRLRANSRKEQKEFGADDFLLVKRRDAVQVFHHSPSDN